MGFQQFRRASQLWGAFFALWLSFFGAVCASPTASFAAAASRPIVVVGPSFGPWSAITHETRAGAEAAVARCRERERRSGLRTGPPTAVTRCPRVLVVSHGCTFADQERPAIRRLADTLAEMQPRLILGAPCDSVAVKLAPRLADLGLRFLAVGVRDPGFAAGLDPEVIGRLGADRSRDMDALVQALLMRSAATRGRDDTSLRVAILHDGTLRTRSRLDQVKAAVARFKAGIETARGRRDVVLPAMPAQLSMVGSSPAGLSQKGPAKTPARRAITGRVVRTQPIVASRVDYQRQVARVLAKKPDAILILASGQEARRILPELARQSFVGVVGGPPEWLAAASLSGVGRALKHASSSGKDAAGAITVMTVLPLDTPFAGAMDWTPRDDQTRRRVALIVRALLASREPANRRKAASEERGRKRDAATDEAPPAATDALDGLAAWRAAFLCAERWQPQPCQRPN